MKKCNTCGKVKPFTEFHKRDDAADKLAYICKPCDAKRSLAYRRTKRGLINKIYHNQKNMAKVRNYPLPEYTKSEFITKMNGSKTFNTLHAAWIKSDYNEKLVPTAIRINPNLPCTLSNIKVMCWGEGNIKGHQDHVDGISTKLIKTINQYTLDGILLNTFHSLSEAGRQTGITGLSNISYACQGKYMTCGGFKWKYVCDL